MLNWKIKYLRLRVQSKDYYSDRLKQLIAHKSMLDKRFRIFESGGIVGDRIWDLEGGEYLDYCHRIKPMIKKRIAWYEIKINEAKYATAPLGMTSIRKPAASAKGEATCGSTSWKW